MDDEDDGDLNKTLGVQRFQQILSPAARLPAEQHRTFNQEDLEGKITRSSITRSLWCHHFRSSVHSTFFPVLQIFISCFIKSFYYVLESCSCNLLQGKIYLPHINRTVVPFFRPPPLTPAHPPPTFQTAALWDPGEKERAQEEEWEAAGLGQQRWSSYYRGGWARGGSRGGPLQPTGRWRQRHYAYTWRWHGRSHRASAGAYMRARTHKHTTERVTWSWLSDSLFLCFLFSSLCVMKTHLALL